jgi:hypothetical protein
MMDDTARDVVPLIDLTLQHGQSLEEARRRLERAVSEMSARFGALVQRVEWTADRTRVKVDGVGFWVEMSVDTAVVRAIGDIPVLGRLLGGRFVTGLEQILQKQFPR